MNRRQFLKAGLACGAATLMGLAGCGAQQSAPNAAPSGDQHKEAEATTVTGHDQLEASATSASVERAVVLNNGLDRNERLAWY